MNALGVNVEASQETLADLFGASVGASGQLGGGLSFAIAQLRSNVVAAYKMVWTLKLFPAIWVMQQLLSQWINMRTFRRLCKRTT